MSIVRTAIRPIVFEPDNLKELGEIFDQVWAYAAIDFGDHPEQIETARIRLATIILDLAKDGQLGRHQITRTALRLIYQARPSTTGE
jgi:hypothetical protein